MTAEQVIVSFLGLTTTALLVVLKLLYDEIRELKSSASDRAIAEAEKKGELRGELNVLELKISRLQTDFGQVVKLKEDVNVCHKRIRELKELTPRS